jgi:ferritin-like metal-binding protein YciE
LREPSEPSCGNRIQAFESKKIYGGIMANEGLKELYIDELKDLYSAETQLVKALPKMAKGAESEELRQGFEEHLEQTKGHVQRLEQIFQALGESPKGKKCKGMEGLVEEGSEVLEEDFEGPVLDAALIGAAQRVEHYEIAGYGTVRALAEALGEDEHVSLLTETLDEEKETDEKLTELAGQINEQAASESDSDEDAEGEEVEAEDAEEVSRTPRKPISAKKPKRVA